MDSLTETTKPISGNLKKRKFNKLPSKNNSPEISGYTS